MHQVRNRDRFRCPAAGRIKSGIRSPQAAWVGDATLVRTRNRRSCAFQKRRILPGAVFLMKSREAMASPGRRISPAKWKGSHMARKTKSVSDVAPGILNCIPFRCSPAQQALLLTKWGVRRSSSYEDGITGLPTLFGSKGAIFSGQKPPDVLISSSFDGGKSGQSIPSDGSTGVSLGQSSPGSDNSLSFLYPSASPL